jgi:hypothetical protein
MRGAHQPVGRRAQRLRALYQWHVRRSESGEMQVAAAVSQNGHERSFACLIARTLDGDSTQ